MTNALLSLQKFQEQVDELLDEYLQQNDITKPLLDAMRYVALRGGKRVRPALVLATATSFGGNREASNLAAIAIEMVHAYSLAHDDLPALDDDDERRGHPSAHRQFDEATAILAGDSLLTEAFAAIAKTGEYISPEFVVHMTKSLAQWSGAAGMVGGQVQDIKHLATSSEELRKMHELKTGALFRCAMELGSLASEPHKQQLQACSEFGRLLGAVFQRTDDILDLEEADESEHERKVNIAYIDGKKSVYKEIRRLTEQAHLALDRMEGTMTFHRELIDWIAHRAD